LLLAACTPKSEHADASPKVETRTFDAAPYRRDARVPAIAYAAFTRDAITISGASGRARLEPPEDAAVGTPFHAASIAKTIVAVCVMKLVEEKKLDLDEDISSDVGFAVRHPTSKERITLRMLLSHTSSIQDLPAEIGTGRNVELGDFLRRELVVDGGAPRAASFLDAGPGERVRYSNTGSSLAAYAVEKSEGKSFARVAGRRVFLPLLMSTTSLDISGAAPTYVGTVEVAHPGHAVYPAADLRSSAYDLARFGRAILRGGELDGDRILSRESVDTMLREHLGWQARTIGGRDVVGHEGEDAGASSGLFLDLASGTGAVVLANGDAFASGDPARAKALQDLLAELLREAVRSPK
jgi:CubicO group peptidase (beta-lactamase class C family)